MMALSWLIGAPIALAQQLPDDDGPLGLPEDVPAEAPDEGTGNPPGTEVLAGSEEVDATNPKYIVIDDPVEDKEAGTQGGPARQPTARPAPLRLPTVPPRITRSEPRPVIGDAPPTLYGRYQVVEVTQAGITENFVNKMERAGRALNEDCIVVQQVFDFGPMPPEGSEGTFPGEVELTQLRECDVGGLGKYAEEVSVFVAPAWRAGNGSVTLDLPQVTVITDYVKLSQPRAGDMKTPPQWLARDTTIKHDAGTYVIIAERARRGALPVLHLTVGDQVFHLEQAPTDEAAGGTP